MQMADPVIRTKLRPPFTRPELVPRPRLQRRIRQGLRGPLTLVTAPAGFGKTTLIAPCVTGCEMPIAWFSLDKDDNRDGRFLNYLVTALQEADHTIGSEAEKQLAASPQTSPELVLTSLINDLEFAGREIALVLDDYHLISNQTVHEGLAFLLEYCPKTFHLVIASRSDPPLALARSRALGQMVELRAADLSFTESEAAQFLNDVMGLHLEAGSVAVLAARTEGWIAGLQMAALSMRDREDLSEFIDGFSGTNRHILYYLLEEVLTSQPPEIEQFLLYTSILRRLTAPLCDAILADNEGMKQGGDSRTAESELHFVSRSATTLEYLERANLFLVPMDDERIWHRYHRLFADLLQARLQQIHENKDVSSLHTRAAHWYERNGLTYEAIYHASLTSDDVWVERLIEQNYMEIFQRRNSESLRFWTGELSRESILKRPRLSIYEAMSRSW